MKRFIFLLAFFPMFVSAQENRIGGRIAYTHTNKSYNFGFGGISFNTDPDYYAGVTTYAGAHFGAHHSKLKVVPEVGMEVHFLLAGAGISLNTEAIQPRIGISAFNFGQIHFGYSIPFFKKIGFQRFYFYSSIQSVLNLTRSQISVINKSPAFIRRGFII